jgi:hypothetical protein
LRIFKVLKKNPGHWQSVQSRYEIADWKSLFGFDLASANQHRLFIQCGVIEVMLGSACAHVIYSVVDGAQELGGEDFLPAAPMLKR